MIGKGKRKQRTVSKIKMKTGTWAEDILWTREEFLLGVAQDCDQKKGKKPNTENYLRFSKLFSEEKVKYDFSSQPNDY